jgi:serine phosphatase RsbU (regulator of sigma subunit)
MIPAERPNGSGTSAFEPEPLATGSEVSEIWLASRLEQLQQISTELTSAVSEAEAATTLMRLLDAPRRSATHGLWIYRPEGQVLELIAQSGMPEESVARFSRIGLDADVPVVVAHREQRTIQATSRAQSEAEFEGLAGAERVTDRFIAVPLIVEDHALGALSLGYHRQPAPEDVMFSEAIAGQVAQTLVRIRLSLREQRRRAELEFLVELTDAAMSANDHHELMQNVTTAAVPALGDWCAVHYLPEGHGAPEVAVAHVDPSKVRWAEELHERHPFDPAAETGVAAVLRSGVTEFISAIDAAVIDDAVNRSTLDESEVRAIVAELQPTSMITVALRTKRRVMGAMQFVSAESGRIYDKEDVALAEVVARGLADPLESAWLSDQQTEIAGALQRNLLPPRLPTIAGVDLAARYLPAGASTVGGDFYDVFAIGEASWAILIGDACGTGPNAAALSSIARHTVRAAARHGADHAQVMDWLNQAIALSDRDLFCTACYATLTHEQGTWTLRSASAGHPLPILSRSGHTSSVGEPGTLLGVFDPIDVSIAEATLSPGDLVVFYTDGVTDLPPPHGIDAEQLTQLVQTLRDRRSASGVAHGIEQSVIDRVSQPHRADDVAMVVVRIENG